jgi:hypothetical protein
VLPNEVNDIITILESGSPTKIGITQISASVNLSYNRIIDEGRWLGNGDLRNNLWLALNVPLTVSCSIKFNASQGFMNSINTSPELFTNRTIRLVFDTRFHNGTTANYFVIDLGTKNYLNNISVTGGSTSGDIVEYTIDYINTNGDFLTYFRNNTNFSSIAQTTEKY